MSSVFLNNFGFFPGGGGKRFFPPFSDGALSGERAEGTKKGPSNFWIRWPRGRLRQPVHRVLCPSPLWVPDWIISLEAFRLPVPPPASTPQGSPVGAQAGGGIQRPTRGTRTGPVRLRPEGRNAPTWPCSRWGLPDPRLAAGARELLPHVFTLTRARREADARRSVFCGTVRACQRQQALRVTEHRALGARTFLPARVRQGDPAVVVNRTCRRSTVNSRQKKLKRPVRFFPWTADRGLRTF